jgi:hypothetical protein
MWRKHGGDDKPCCIEITRKHGDLWVFNDAINGRQKIWVGDELVALYHKPHAVADGASSTSTICIDLRATDLDDAMSYIKEACISIAQKVADGEAPPRKESDDGNGGWVRPEEVGLFRHVDPVYGAQHQAKFAADMSTVRLEHEEGLLVRDAVEAAGLLEQLEQPAAKKAPTGRKTSNCEHGRRKHRCKDCGTGYCTHGRVKNMCKDCGTGYCTHGRVKNMCKDCGTGYCKHGHQKSKCKDCGTGHCQHGRQKDRCKDCGTGHCQHGRENGRACKDCGRQ